MTTTTHFGYTVPVVGGNTNAWGSLLNTDISTLDTDLYNAAFGKTAWGGLAGGSANALTFTVTPVLTAYADGLIVRGRTGAAANTGSSTVNVSGLGVITIYYPNESTTLSAGDLPANTNITLLIKATGGNKAILLGLTSTTLSSLTVNGSSALNGVTTIAAAGTPLVVNSTDSTVAKLVMQDNGVAQGYIGASAAYAAEFFSSSLTLFWAIDNTTAALMPLSTYDLGKSANRLGTVYATSINANGTAGIIGTATNTTRPAGSVGEVIDSELLVGSAVSLTTNVAANITSISLTAGNWLVWGNAAFLTTGSTSVTAFASGIGTTSATLGTIPGKGAQQTDRMAAFVPAASEFIYPTGMRRLSLSGTTTVYLVGLSTFTLSNMVAYGYLGAMRTD